MVVGGGIMSYASNLRCAFDRANMTNAVFGKLDLNGERTPRAPLDGTGFEGANIRRIVFADVKVLLKTHSDACLPF
jgi:uncharacterized protein YjbI with pentapeptide repeats